MKYLKLLVSGLRLSVVTIGVFCLFHSALGVAVTRTNPQWQMDEPLRLALESSLQGSQITTLNVEVDYMVDGAHSHELLQPEIDALVAMFACNGITLNIEMSDAIPHTDVLGHVNGNVFGNPDPVTGFWGLKQVYGDHNGESGWHYCIMAHLYDYGAGTGSSGLAEILGDDFIVSLGGWWTKDQVGTPFDRASTFAHEFGHNLGLLHAGDQSQSLVTQYKPNYASVMAYRYQLKGMRHAMYCEGISDTCNPLKNIDYSHGLQATLDETALDETFGMGYGPVDWNCNGEIDVGPVACDLASYPYQNDASYQIITDYDDWSNIVDVTATMHRAALTEREVISCLAHEEMYTGFQSGESYCLAPELSVEPCTYTYFDSDGDGIGDLCDACAGPAAEDYDGDNICSDIDNCPEWYNPDQTDLNGNGVGDACECAGAFRVFNGEAQSDNLGWRVASAGDIDNDGYVDVIMGASWVDPTPLRPNVGRAYVHSGRTGELLMTMDGEAPNNRFGVAVSGAGDVNGDSYDDVIVGAFHNHTPAPEAGRAYVFYGGPGPYPVATEALSADLILDGLAEDDNLGWSVAGIGDVDDHPGPDLLVGCRGNTSSGTGKAVVFSGQTGVPVYIHVGEFPNDSYGYEVADGGDFNNDGIADYLVAALDFDSPVLYGSGRAYVYSGVDGSTLATITGDPGSWLSGDLTTVGDLNGDGFHDLLIGAPLASPIVRASGQAYVFLGSGGPFPLALTTADAHLTFDGSISQAYMGWAVSYMRDLNGDGINELIVGEPNGGGLGVNGKPGLAHIYSGADGAELYVAPASTRADWYARSVAGSERYSDLESFDVVVGAFANDGSGSDAGAVFVHMLGDLDGDGVLANCDNCPGVANADQTDSDVNGVGDVCQGCCNCPGDADNNDSFTIADVTYGIAYIFSGGAPPHCADEGDTNGSNAYSIEDVTAGIAYIFSGGPPPICGTTGL